MRVKPWGCPAPATAPTKARQRRGLAGEIGPCRSEAKARAAAQSGMLSCFFQGFSTVFLRSMLSARQIRRRVERSERTLVTTLTTLAGSPQMAVVLFGAWSQLIVGYWSGLDVLVNPYSEDDYLRGRVSVRAMRDYDVAVRHPESFAFAEDVNAG